MIRVLIVDDSAVVRKILTEELSKYKDIEVVGSAIDPYAAREKIATLQPDIITLDLDMPRMDGLSFLAKLMKHYPMPVVVVSSLTPQNSVTALRALELGAVEVISKPGSQFSVPDVHHQLIHAIRAAASAKIRLPKRSNPSAESAAAKPASELSSLCTTHKVIAIGASTGGTQAIKEVLQELPTDTPGIVIVQHMPEHFTAAFAERLNRVCRMDVREARNRDDVVTGVALVAPGNHHMVLQQSGTRYMVQIKDGPPIHYQRPAVDVLFSSVAKSAGPNAVGVILTGMGADGAKGLLAMRQRGAHTIAQDENSCIVFGMPREAIRLGAAEAVLPLAKVPQAVLSMVSDEATPVLA